MYRIITLAGEDGIVQQQRHPAIPIMPRSGLYLTPMRGTWRMTGSSGVEASPASLGRRGHRAAGRNGKPQNMKGRTSEMKTPDSDDVVAFEDMLLRIRGQWKVKSAAYMDTFFDDLRKEGYTARDIWAAVMILLMEGRGLVAVSIRNESQ